MRMQKNIGNEDDGLMDLEGHPESNHYHTATANGFGVSVTAFPTTESRCHTPIFPEFYIFRTDPLIQNDRGISNLGRRSPALSEHSGDTEFLAAPTHNGSVQEGGSYHGNSSSAHGGNLYLSTLNKAREARRLQNPSWGDASAPHALESMQGFTVQRGLGLQRTGGTLGGSVHGGAGHSVPTSRFSTAADPHRSGIAPFSVPMPTRPENGALGLPCLPEDLPCLPPSVAPAPGGSSVNATTFAPPPLGAIGVIGVGGVGAGVGVGVGNGGVGARPPRMILPGVPMVGISMPPPLESPFSAGSQASLPGTPTTSERRGGLGARSRGVGKIYSDAKAAIPGKLQHPQVEKARRDRINTLLIELRCVGLCSGSAGGACVS